MDNKQVFSATDHYHTLLKEISKALAPVSEEYAYQKSHPDKYEYRTKPITISFEQGQKLAEINEVIKLTLKDGVKHAP